jgi:hypothetical protein
MLALPVIDILDDERGEEVVEEDGDECRQHDEDKEAEAENWGAWFRD